MIRHARIQGFRCLRDVQIRFEPLTVLVGPNASGKTALLDALDTQGGWSPQDEWRHGGRRLASVQLTFDDGKTLERRDLQTGFRGNTLYRSQSLHLDIERLRDSNETAEAPRLDRSGGNLTNVFATFRRDQQAEVASQLASLVPVLSDVNHRPRPNRTGHHRLVFQDRWDPECWYEPTEVSDGTILLMAFLVLQHQTPPVDLLTIEEPERGLHPYLLGELVSLLRKLATGDLGPRPIQVVLATHSADLLEFTQPKEVRFLAREQDEGGVVIEEAPTEEPEWAEAVREYEGSIGRLWLSGSLGGVPGS